MDDPKKSYLKAAFNSRFCFHQTFFTKADVLLLTHSFSLCRLATAEKPKGISGRRWKAISHRCTTTPSVRRWLCAGKQRPKQSAKGGDKGALLGERDARDCLYLFLQESGRSRPAEVT
ncbi:hypothetical protein CEXT_508831 [Caerostris extrusa]|uniref:Uncharacterized protein n=1 Tax=Caerostris extrusa TaxID=172846 RepID=A0AAV4MA19_CAEEX|nr:hypothetical protein CEXT_508831 [Caerostris extrusa]